MGQSGEQIFPLSLAIYTKIGPSNKTDYAAHRKQNAGENYTETNLGPTSFNTA